MKRRTTRAKQINNFVQCDCKLVTRAEPHSVSMVFGCDFIALVVSFILKVRIRFAVKKGNTSSNDVQQTYNVHRTCIFKCTRKRQRKKQLALLRIFYCLFFLLLSALRHSSTFIYTAQQIQYSHLFPFRIKFVTILISLIYSNSLWKPLFSTPWQQVGVSLCKDNVLRIDLLR